MKKIFTFLIITFFVITKSNAQYPFYFNSTIENNLPSNEVYSIYKDHKGYVWIGCDAGLYRFNGNEYQYYSCKEQLSKSVTGICETKKGIIYCYNFNGQIFKIEKGKMSTIKNWDLAISNISTVQNDVVITSEKGLTILSEDGKLKTLTIFSSAGKKETVLQTTCSRSTHDNSVYYLHNRSVLKLDYHQSIPKTFQVETNDNLGEYLLSKSTKTPWLIGVMTGKLFKLEGKNYKETHTKQLDLLLQNRKITNFVEGENNSLWILTYSGAINYNPITGNVQLFYPSISFSDYIIDNEGNHWFSTLHNGIIRIPNMVYKVWNIESNALPNDQITHLVKTDKELFFSTSDGKVGSINSVSQKITILPFHLKADIGFLYFDRIDQCIYFNVSNTIYKIQNSNIIPIKNEFPPIKNMCHTQEGYFFATSRGLFHYQNLTEQFSGKIPLSTEWTRAIRFENNNLFVGDNSGIRLFQKTSTVYKPIKNLLINKQIISIDNQYVLSFDGIIYKIDDKKIKQITALNSKVRVYQLKYQNEFIYITSNQGLFRYSLKRKQLKQLSKLSGLASNNIKEIEISPQGIWLATDNGLQLIPKNAFDQKHYRSKIDLQTIKINSNEISINDKIILYPNDKLTLGLNALAYRSNGTGMFAYRFENQTEWVSIPSSIQELKFPNLPSGEYSIHLKYIDYKGVDSKNEIKIPVKVYPPFWLRGWFISLITLLFVAIVIMVFKYRIHLIRKKQIKEIKQLRLENELRLTQQNALKAQMNPHFLFNVLNSIKGFIYENDKKNASKYLSDFSNLVRKVLDMSSLPSVSLDEEIEILEIYIQLEQMLLHDDFNYFIDVDPNIDTNYIKIPTLIIQPYIENAFKHGLRHKEGEKNLIVSFSMDEEVLMIKISDNGIGRNASQNINAQIAKEHTSFATSALEKRLELLNHSSSDFVGVEIIDNFTEDLKPNGTTVIIRIHV